MKKVLLLGALSFLISSSVFARETNSMRSSTELVKLGDSEASLLQKMGKPKPRFFVYQDGNFSCAATEYKYDIDMQAFTEAENKIKHAFPKHKVMITYMPLFDMFGILTRIDELEAELIQDGLVAHVDRTPSRLGIAFDWEQKHNPVVNNGKC